MKYAIHLVTFVFFNTLVFSSPVFSDGYVFEAGHESLQKWLLPEFPPYPKHNVPTKNRVELGKKLFFDPRVSGDGNMSCATCHSPMLGWSDGLPTGVGHKNQILGRATPTIVNTAYNYLQMWDGRKRDLEDQATGPMEAVVEMNTDIDGLLKFLKDDPTYSADFQKAYPNEGVTIGAVSKAIASFERTVVSRNSPFDQWVRGDENALTKKELKGFKLFVDPNKGNCEVCHSAPNFTDDGFHNIGLAQFGTGSQDLGRHKLRPLKILKGAFKTPTLRDVNQTAPYFHDGSAANLNEVMSHYVKGGEVKTNLSPSMKPLKLSKSERKAIIAFVNALTSPQEPFVLPVLPLNQ